MCGIAAMLLYPQDRPASMWQEIKQTFTGSLLFNEERGKAATGLAIVQRETGVLIEKSQCRATEFVATPEYDRLLDILDAQTVLLLGHVRHPTKGAPARNENNHPVQAGPILGVHNGHIDNDDDLFARCGCPRRAEVDSEIIFRLLETLSPAQLNGSYLQAAQKQLARLQGKFTFLAADRRKPGKLLVVKHQNPLSLHFHAEWQALIFSSRYLFLRKRFGSAVLYENLPADQLLLFDVETLPHLCHHPVDTFPL